MCVQEKPLKNIIFLLFCSLMACCTIYRYAVIEYYTNYTDENYFKNIISKNINSL